MTQVQPDIREVEVIAPNLKRRLSGVTATVVRLVPLQAQRIGIVTTGPGLPDDLPHIPLGRLFFLPRDRWRVWHARRNTEMALGLILRHLFRRRLRMLFTSAAQRHHKPFTRWLIRQMDGVVATSPQAASYLEVKARVVMHGVDTDTFTPTQDKPALRRALGLPEQGLLLGCFGRIRAQKGVDLLVEAALALLPDRPDVHIIFTGRVTDDNRAFHADLVARLSAAGLGDRVRFLGELPWSDVVRHYQALDLFVAPARWEGFGLTPLEAMACGVPSIGARVGAFEALILEGTTGSLVPPGDAPALTGAIRSWIDDRPRLAAAGPVARDHVVTNHRIEAEADTLVGLYRGLLDGAA
ncbi:MAG: glycosyltransferase family 4 protein [Albidovulum sp.]